MAFGEQKRQNPGCVKRYWEIIADHLSKAGWEWTDRNSQSAKFVFHAKGFE
jgi:hypothetical protein